MNHNLSHYGIELIKNDIRLNYQLFGLYKRDVIITYHFNNCEKKIKYYKRYYEYVSTLDSQKSTFIRVHETLHF